MSPIDKTGNALGAVWIAAKEAKKISFLVHTGVMTSTSAQVVTLYVANNVSGTKNKAITSAGAAATLTLPHYWVRAAATDTWTKTTVTSSTFNLVNTNDGQAFLIEVDTDKMGTFVASSVTYNAEYVRLGIATPGAHACLYAVQAILTGLRYQEDSPPTAIT